MSKVFLDVGAYDGASVRFFRQHHKEARKFNIHCFEPHPESLVELRKVENVTVIPAAAWVYDGTAPLYLGKPKGATLFKDKTTNVDASQFVVVPCVDIARYMKEHFKRSDEIWMKLNVEGAEYAIIRHLNNEGLLPWIHRLYLTWHAYKIPSLADVHDEVAALVPNAITTWRKRSICPLR